MKALKKLLLPLLAVTMAATMGFSAAACVPNDDNGGTNPGGSQAGGETPGGETSGGTTPGGETPGGTTPGGGPTEEKPDGQTEFLGWGAYNESLYVTYQTPSPAEIKVEYRAEGTAEWHGVDQPLVRATAQNAGRADVIGLAAGKYNVKLTTANGVKELNEAIEVKAYDRSGYAHFNYTEGVGAYHDDGTLKEGALVIYLTEENKNNVLDCAYVDGNKVDISQYMVATQSAEGVTAGQQTGIGQLLNNRRYAGADRMNVGIAALCNQFNCVAIRVIGKVSAEDPADCTRSTILGLTDYNGTGNGGSKGDNGRMARMVNAKNLTIEGVGEDASLFGWGIHFIASDVLGNYPGAGKGFEVRNLTFENYPEDAVGMEGIQGLKYDQTGSVTSGASDEGADLLSPVERCWIHHNTFLPGSCTNPAESDKKEGDGSCDFKRGRYYTLAYNYFEYCHKTNLIGSSDTSLQYDITFHHNWWNNCGSRIPLLRRANIHFYNNYVSGDIRDTRADLSYVTSARANSYMFSENNYFDGCKQIVELKAGAVKSFGDMIYADFNGNGATIVTDRLQKVENSCKFIFKNIDYSSFDTDPTQFYFKDGQSDCLLDDAVTARQKAMTLSGANGHGVTDTAMNEYTPSTAVQVGENGATITLPSAKNDTEVNGVLFRGLTGISGGEIKFKGQGITFTLAAEAELVVSTATTGDPAPELVGADGRVYAHKFTDTLTIVLQKGTYFIASGQKDKETKITGLFFGDTAASSQARIEGAAQALNALNGVEPELTEQFEELLAAATSAYGGLTQTEREKFNLTYPQLVEGLNTARSGYNALLVKRVEDLIESIGDVTADSHDRIDSARTAYEALPDELKAQVTNYQALCDAEEQFKQFAVTDLINRITEFRLEVNGITQPERQQVARLLETGEKLNQDYLALSQTDRAKVENYGYIAEAIAKLTEFKNLFDFEDALAYFADGHTLTTGDASHVAALKNAYAALTPEQQQKLTAAQRAEFTKIITDFENIEQATVSTDFNDYGNPSDTTGTFTIGAGSEAKSKECTVNGVTYKKGLKMSSKSSLIVNANGKSLLTLYLIDVKTLKVDGVETAAPVAAPEAGSGIYVLTIELEPGQHTITKGNGENSVYFATLAPAA